MTNMQRYYISFVLVILLLISRLSSAATLHAIIIADTNDSRIGSGTTIDRKKIKDLIKPISNHTGLFFKEYDIYGDQFTYGKVTDILNGLSLSEDDVVIFYYSGHGINPETGTIWPSLAIGFRHMQLNDVITTIKNKNPRLFIIIADACNNFSKKKKFSSKAEESIGRPLRKNYRTLFLNYSGYIITSSSKPGEYSYTDNYQNGSYFTNNFLRSLNKELALYNFLPNWNNIMERAEKPIIFSDVVQNPQTKVYIRLSRFKENNCYYFYKPGGILCCKNSSGTTCEESNNKCPYSFYKANGVLCCRDSTGRTTCK
jgi:hypothetical protein